MLIKVNKEYMKNKLFNYYDSYTKKDFTSNYWLKVKGYRKNHC